VLQLERPRPQIGAREDQKVESVEEDRILGAAEVLEKIKRRQPIFIHSDNFAIDNGFVRKPIKGPRYKADSCVWRPLSNPYVMLHFAHEGIEHLKQNPNRVDKIKKVSHQNGED
jgi:hypothetical protein